jgi:ferredoxin
VVESRDDATREANGPIRIGVHCMQCELCCHIAPDHFSIGGDDGCVLVVKQPETAGERQLCRRALADCPAEAIFEEEGQRGPPLG